MVKMASNLMLYHVKQSLGLQSGLREKKLDQHKSSALLRSVCGLAFDHLVEPEGLAYADHLLTHEGNQKPASLRSGILRNTKKTKPFRYGFFISLSLRTSF